MIKKFSVENFKNFNDKVTIDFANIRNYDFNDSLIKNNLVNKAIIYGYNSSGKSNLGLAIMDITSHLTNFVFNHSKYKYFTNLESAKKVVSFEYTFLFKNKEYLYKYEKDERRYLIKEEIVYNGKTIFYYDYQNKVFKNNIKELENFNLNNLQFHNVNDSVIKYIVTYSPKLGDENPIKLIYDFANNMLWFRSLRENEFMGKLANGVDISDYIVRQNLVDKFQLFLKECDVETKLCSTQSPFGYTLCVKKGKNIVPFFEICSTGTACLALFFYWKETCFDKIDFLFLDEFDAFYNEKLSYHLLDSIYKNTNMQTVITTHNSSLATNTNARPDCIMIIQNNKLNPLCDLTKKIIRRGHNLRKLMEAGEFDEDEEE